MDLATLSTASVTGNFRKRASWKSATKSGTTLLLGGRVYSPGSSDATAMAIVDGTVAWVGRDAVEPFRPGTGYVHLGRRGRKKVGQLIQDHGRVVIDKQ